MNSIVTGMMFVAGVLPFDIFYERAGNGTERLWIRALLYTVMVQTSPLGGLRASLHIHGATLLHKWLGLVITGLALAGILPLECGAVTRLALATMLPLEIHYQRTSQGAERLLVRAMLYTVAVKGGLGSTYHIQIRIHYTRLLRRWLNL